VALLARACLRGTLRLGTLGTLYLAALSGTLSGFPLSAPRSLALSCTVLSWGSLRGTLWLDALGTVWLGALSSAHSGLRLSALHSLLPRPRSYYVTAGLEATADSCFPKVEAQLTFRLACKRMSLCLAKVVLFWLGVS